VSTTVPTSVAPDRPATTSGRPIGSWAFLGVTITALGGPLALAAQAAPGIVADASVSAGFAMVAAAVVFGAPLAIMVRYSQEIASAGGLYAFVEAAAGRRVARVQAAFWLLSYVLYLLYTTAAIVYDTLPVVLPGIGPYQPLLEIAIPVTLAAVMLAGRTVALAATGLLAVGQLVLVGILAAVTIGHDAPISSFSPTAPVGTLATAAGQTALLYVCGSLPLFLGGEVVRPHRTIPRGLVIGFLLVAAGIVATVFPLAANPSFGFETIPGVAIAQVFGTHALAVSIGIGVAASTAGVMLVEYIALTRLVHALTGRSLRQVTAVVAVALVVTAPISLINPDGFYQNLLKPSLIALWLSQLVVSAVYPRFVAKRGGRTVPAWALAVVSCAFAVYGIVATLQHGSS
jgi:amino acid transporter